MLRSVQILLSKKNAYAISKIKQNKEIELNNCDWSTIYSQPFKCTKESKFHWFQLQLLHRIFINKLLHIAGLVISPLFLFAQKFNIFPECFIAKEIWIEVERWIFEFFNVQTSFDTNLIFHGKYVNIYIHLLENLLISFTKQYVFRTEIKSSSTNVKVSKMF